MVGVGLCGLCAPSWKRKVDSIFPRDAGDGLVKGNMEKLTFYVLSSPEKLDRVGEYLYQRVCRDIYRRRFGFVVIGVDAMDQLLQACHSQTLNLFVESFLKMVQKLLESTDPNLQILATQSFVKFSNIEEDTPSYHRRYDFFVSKFASMCHNNSENDILRNELRTAGIRGLKSVVRKTVSDDLAENIWDTSHMEKIIPSLLFNMEQGRQSLLLDENDAVINNRGDGDIEEESPKLAENCMRDLVNKATFGHVRSFIKPVLHHFDVFELWVPNDFAVHTFRVVMYAIQSQYSYAVIETLMNHIASHNLKSSAKVRTSMADVLAKIIDIAAGDSVGPSVLEIVNSIVNHLQVSTKMEGKDENEKAYRETLIAALGEYVTHLPDYQKIEIMKFIMQKVPSGPDRTEIQRLLQNMLLKSLLMVGSKYHTTHLSTTFPISFLQPLLTLCQDDDPELRLLVQSILQSLIDRHRNQDKLMTPTLKFDTLVRDNITRTDTLFVKKNGGEIFTNLFLSLEKKNNGIANFNSVFTTICLFCVELYCDDTLPDFIRLALSFQDLALTSEELTSAQKIHLHVVALAFLTLTADFFPPLKEYTAKVIKARKDYAIHLIPPIKSRYEAYEPSSNLQESCLLNQELIFETLKTEGVEIASKFQNTNAFPRHSWVDSAHAMQSNSATDLNNISIDVDSGQSTPVLPRKLELTGMTVESFKQILTEPPEVKKEAENLKKKEISAVFNNSDFNEIVEKAAAKRGNFQNKLSEIFTKISLASSMEASKSNSSNSIASLSSPPMSNGINGMGKHRQDEKIQFPQYFEL